MPVDVQTALEYLGRIRGVYGVDSREYLGFIDTMKDFKAGRADSRETHKRVITLLRGNIELVAGYAAYMPPGHTIRIPEDSQENILVKTPTGSMEIAQDGTVVKETNTQIPQSHIQEKRLPELTERQKRLLEKLRAKAVESREQEKYETLITSFEANLQITSEQRKATLDDGQCRGLVEGLQELLVDGDELKQALSGVR